MALRYRPEDLPPWLPEKVRQGLLGRATPYERQRLESYWGSRISAWQGMQEAKEKQELSKEEALGYFAPIQAQLGAMEGKLITPEQQVQMETTRRAQLGAYGQNIAGMFTDPYSGVQAGQRRQVAMGIAGRQATLPIELQLDIAEQNRLAQLGLVGAQAGVAGQMAGVQMGYQYDPGMQYLAQLGYGGGYAAGTQRRKRKPFSELYPSFYGAGATGRKATLGATQPATSWAM